MSRSFVIARREFASYWLSPIAYVVLIVFYLLNSVLFMNSLFGQNVASLAGMFGIWASLFIFIIPAITMRLWAEERMLGTLELLLTYPVRIIDLVLGKFLAALIFMAVGFALTLVIAIPVAAYGDLDWGPVAGGYLGGLLMASAFLSIGLFFSSLTSNQIVAFLLTLVALLGLNLTQIFSNADIWKWVVTLLSWIGLGSHFTSFARGVVSSSDVLYFLIFTIFFLWMNVVVLEAKKWRG